MQQDPLTSPSLLPPSHSRASISSLYESHLIQSWDSEIHRSHQHQFLTYDVIPRIKRQNTITERQVEKRKWLSIFTAFWLQGGLWKWYNVYSLLHFLFEMVWEENLSGKWLSSQTTFNGGLSWVTLDIQRMESQAMSLSYASFFPINYL